MKQDWKPEELRATAAEIRGAVMPKSITPEMVGGMLAGLTEAVAEVVETLGEIPREHVRVRVNTLDSEGLTACSTDATVYVDIFTTKGYPAVNMPRKEIKVNGDGIAEFDVPHGFQFAVYAKHPGLSASFQWVHTAAIGERPIIVLWCVPVGVWWFGAIFHGTEDEDMDWGDELYRPVPYLFDHFTDDWDEIEARVTPDLRPSENFMDYYNYGIMVATADTCFVIAPNSFSVERMAWSNSRAYGMYIPGMEHINHHTEAGKWQGDYAEAQNRARADMDGNMNTAKILRAVNGALAAEWVGSVVYDYSENRWLPSAGQVYLIWLNRTAINRLMQEAMNSDAETWAYALLPYQNDKGQWQNPNGHYEYWWTSTVFDDSCSWVVNYDGNIGGNRRGRTNDVRAVSAFHFEY